MARGQSPYQGRYTFPVASTVERSMQQAAGAQAQMFAGLGEEFGGAIDKYFKGKDEKKMAEGMAENRIALDVVYGGGDVPADRAERIKDIRGVMRASGGYQNFVARLENFELKQQNKTVIEQNMALKTLQMKTIEEAQRDREKTRATTEEFARFLTTPRPGQLTPKGRELEATLGRFEPSEVPGTPEFEALEISEPMGARPDIGAAAFKSRMEKERLPDRPAPMLEPSGRFMQSASEAGLSPEAGLKAYDIAQQKEKSEIERASAGLDFGKDRETYLQLIDKPTADLRKEFQAQPSVKDFNKVNAAYNKIVSAFASIKRLPDEKKAAADMAVIFSYMKILDPGSTVREGEYATAQNTTGVPGKIRNWWNNMKDGQILNETQRQAFSNVARDIAQAQFDDLKTQMDFYKSIADKKKIDASRVIPQEFLDIAEKGLPIIGAGDGGTITTESGFEVGAPILTDDRDRGRDREEEEEPDRNSMGEKERMRAEWNSMSDKERAEARQRMKEAWEKRGEEARERHR